VIARSVDRRRGLAFEVSASTRYGRSSGLSVWLAEGAQAAPRRAMLSRPLVVACEVPGQRVRGFAGLWAARTTQSSRSSRSAPGSSPVAARRRACRD
jgi:hypothetical protein